MAAERPRRTMTTLAGALLAASAAIAALFAVAPLPAAAADAKPDGSAAVAGTIILGPSSYSRCFTMGATPRIKRDTGQIEPYTTDRNLTKATKADFRATPAPPTTWRDSDFDDSEWVRVRGFAGTSASLGGLPVALICARTRFALPDPAKAGQLSLSLSFVGGAAVYLNGTEIARAFLPAGELKPETPAEAYPPEAYLDPDGFLLRRGWGDPQQYPDRFKTRVRTLNVTLPANLLKQGGNVLAVQIHCAATSEIQFTSKVRQHERFYANWGQCVLEASRELSCGLLLTAAAGSAAVPNTARPSEMQVWNHPTVQRLDSGEYADPNEAIKPIDIRGARNGAFSGQVVVGSPQAIVKLKATATELKGEGGAIIPASAIQLRFSQPDAPYAGGGFDSLHPEAPEEVAVDKAAGGAIQPIWVTVRVPRDAAPGVYSGKLTISSGSAAAPVETPIRLKVADWTLPESSQFATHVGLIQSPDSVALRYGVPMWSQEHWKLLENSFELLGQVGNDTAYIPLLRRTHFGNEHGMVRWVRQDGGGWTHDFSIAERYLDLARKHLGKPAVISLYVWEVYTGGAWAFGGKGDAKGKGLGFSILDPKTGQLEEAVGPEWGSPEMQPFLKPVLDGLRDILKKRELDGSIMVGLGGDTRPSKAAVDDLRALLPGVPWEVHTHPMLRELHGVPVGYLANVWAAPRAPEYGEKHQHGWKNPFLWTAFPREGIGSPGPLNESANPVRYLLILEGMLCGGGRGIGRVGADFWPAFKDSRGQFRGSLVGRYPDSGGGGSLSVKCSDACLLAPGQAGAVSTVRFEMLRAGAQECEARILIEKALIDPTAKAKLDPALAERCQKLLDDRVEAIRVGGVHGWPWFVSSGWQERSEKLFEAAGEVARAVSN